MTTDDYAARYAAAQAAAERDTRAYLREDADRTPAEQAAIAALDQRRWMLLHTYDRDICVILMLSRLGLLRDRADEDRQAASERAMAAITERVRSADRIALGQLLTLAEQAADRLDTGEEAATVADWLRTTRDAIHAAQDRAKSASGVTP